MADISNYTQNITIYNADGTTAVTVTTDGAKERLDVATDIPYDTVTGSVETINHIHHEIHEGNHYLSSVYDTLGDGDTLSFYFKNPTGTQSHILWKVSSRDCIKFEVYEGPTVSANGSSYPPVGNNRNSSNTSNISLYTDPTVTSNGTLLFEEGCAKRGSIGAEGIGDNEFILKENEDYLFLLTSLDADNNCTLILSWYEE